MLVRSIFFNVITNPQNFRQWLLDSAKKEAERYYDADQMLCLIPRETIWYAITLLESSEASDVALANKILAHTQVDDGTHSPATLFVLLQRYPHLLSASAKNNILNNLKSNLPISATVRYSDGNVNHPLAAFVHLICAGELFEMPAYSELGHRLLQDFHRTISARRHKHHLQAEMAEYNSPTYTALDLWFFAIAAEFVQNQQARALALFLEQRLWLNVALHWHAPSQQFAGPFSRAYAEDSAGGFSALHCTFAFAMQQPIFLDADLPRRFAHPSALIENALIAILNFHVPEAAKEIALSKSYPTAFRMTTYCEQYHENSTRQENQRSLSCFDDQVYAGGWGDLTTCMTAEYCLGTASRPYVNGGQNDVFSLRYRRAEHISSLQDFRGMYSRLVFNGGAVGQDNFCHTVGGDIDSSYLYEEGRGFVFQHKNLALVNYIPKPQGNTNVAEIRIDLIFSYHAPFDQLLVGGSNITEFPHEFNHTPQIIIQDFRTLIAVLPSFAKGIKEHRGRIWINGDHLMISLYLYKGKKRNFTREHLSSLCCGFAFCVESTDHFAAHDDISRFISAAAVSTNLVDKRLQKTTLKFDGNEMVFVLDPFSERIAQRTWNETDLALFHTDVESRDKQVCDYVLNGPYVR